MPDKLIISAGMYRSASTFQFNVIRVILEIVHGEKKVYSCFYNDYDPNDHRPIHLVKVHRYFEDLADKADLIFTSIRPVQSIRSSMRRRREYLAFHPNEPFRRESLEQEMDSMLKDYKQWRKRADFVQEYAMLEMKRALFIRYLGLLKADFIYVYLVEIKMKKEMRVPKYGNSQKTLLHAGHITKCYDPHD